MTQAAATNNTTGQSMSTEPTTDQKRKWLRDMQMIREFENRTMQAYQQAKIGGFCHIYSGQEACAVGCTASVNDDDPIITAYRDHGHALARGMTPASCIAEMFGKLSGCAKGKGGSMHMFDRSNWLFGGHGIVGAQTPLGAGLAFATKYEHEVLGKQVTGEESKRRSRCASWATARSTRARSTSRSTSRRSTTSRWSTSSRTTATPWAPRSIATRRTTRT